jgi:sulfate transport system permease protein
MIAITGQAAAPRARRVMPGFGLTMGVTLLYVTLIILLPIAAMLIKTAELGPAEYWRQISQPRAVATYQITLGAALAATAFNAGFGLLLAWVLVRYEFFGKRLLDTLVDFPFALPTAVAGLALVTVLGPNGWAGRYLEPMGLQFAFALPGVIVAMTFTSLPFVVRSVQPVLEDVAPEVEEAARSLGATRWQIFARVIWPQILPAFISGCVLSFARSISEFGAVVFIAGNLPFRTEVTSLLIFIRLEEYNYGAAAALASVLLAVAFATLFATNVLQAWQARYADASR